MVELKVVGAYGSNHSDLSCLRSRKQGIMMLSKFSQSRHTAHEMMSSLLSKPLIESSHSHTQRNASLIPDRIFNLTKLLIDINHHRIQQYCFLMNKIDEFSRVTTRKKNQILIKQILINIGEALLKMSFHMQEIEKCAQHKSYLKKENRVEKSEL